MVKRKSMMFYYDWRNILVDSFDGNYDTIGRIVMALLNYAECGEMPVNLSDTEMIAFNFMYGQVDRDSAKYMDRVERNRLNGIKSAEARKNKAKEENNQPFSGLLETAFNLSN